VRRAGAKNSQ